MLYAVRKNDYGEEYFLATLPEIWKLVFNKKKELNLIDVKSKLNKVDNYPAYVGEKGEEYYFIWRRNGRYVID